MRKLHHWVLLLGLSINLANAAETHETCRQIALGKLCMQQHVIDAMPNDVIWHWQAKGTEDSQVLNLQPSFLLTDNFQLSPSGQFLAVVSVGEGHSILEVFDVTDWFSGQAVSAALHTINPYPGWIQVGDWTDKGLQLLTDRILPIQLVRHSAVDELPQASAEEVTYWFNPFTGQLMEQL